MRQDTASLPGWEESTVASDIQNVRLNSLTSLGLSKYIRVYISFLIPLSQTLRSEH